MPVETSGFIVATRLLTNVQVQPPEGTVRVVYAPHPAAATPVKVPISTAEELMVTVGAPAPVCEL